MLHILSESFPVSQFNSFRSLRTWGFLESFPKPAWCRDWARGSGGGGWASRWATGVTGSWATGCCSSWTVRSRTGDGCGGERRGMEAVMAIQLLPLPQAQVFLWCGDRSDRIGGYMGHA